MAGEFLVYMEADNSSEGLDLCEKLFSTCTVLQMTSRASHVIVSKMGNWLVIAYCAASTMLALVAVAFTLV